MIEAFGTNKQKRALSSRRLNQVGSDTLHQAVAKAANTVIDQKGLEGKPQVMYKSWIWKSIFFEKINKSSK